VELLKNFFSECLEGTGYSSISEIGKVVLGKESGGTQIHQWISDKRGGIPSQWIPVIIEKLNLDTHQKEKLISITNIIKAEKQIKKKVEVVNKLIGEIDQQYKSEIRKYYALQSGKDDKIYENIKIAITSGKKKESFIYPNRLIPVYGIDKNLRLSYLNWPGSKPLQNVTSVYFVDSNRFSPNFNLGDYIGINGAYLFPIINKKANLYLYEDFNQKYIGRLERLVPINNSQILSIQKELDKKVQSKFSDLIEKYKIKLRLKEFISECDIWLIAKSLNNDDWTTLNFIDSTIPAPVTSKRYFLYLFKKHILDSESRKPKDLIYIKHDTNGFHNDNVRPSLKVIGKIAGYLNNSINEYCDLKSFASDSLRF
jgi:hypothetical protein